MNTLQCQTDQRRQAVRGRQGWNGLDYIEVDDKQTTLSVFFLGKAPEGLTKRNFTLTGGRTERDQVTILDILVRPQENPFYDDQVDIHVDKPGDYSVYTLSLAGLENIDPRYSSLEFSFKANCPTHLDCAAACACETPTFEKPTIDYLAKDYGSFRQLILDRLALTCPDWTERHVPDLGIALVELLAYTGDYLSYYQDAVATEAYLATARRRPSVRRHTRLTGYKLSEGCNSRALVAIETSRNLHFKAADVMFITGLNHLLPIGSRAALTSPEIQGVPPAAYEVFEPIAAGAEIRVWKANNALRFYTWGNRECCIPKGATSATLSGQLAVASLSSDASKAQAAEYDDLRVRLATGDFLIVEEVLGPVTGKPGDAGPNHRQAVRLTSVTQSRDELFNQPVIEIEWSEEDALTFDLCVSAVGAAPECQYLEDISVARGNVVLVDHGRRTGPEDLGVVPVESTAQCCECEGQPSEPVTVAGRYRPRLQSLPLTFAAPVAAFDSAADIFHPAPQNATPSIVLSSGSHQWTPRYDLLSSSSNDRHFVVEMEESGEANIRFGDGTLGRAPTAGSSFSANYRIGNGTAGNVGAGAISLLVHRESQLSNDITRVWNPLPAQGGAAPEPMAAAKLNAPHAFRFGPEALQRAITPDDYAAIAARHKKVQRAAARLAWSGSWYEAAVGLDVKAVYAAQSASIVPEVAAYLDHFRRIGHDLDVAVGEYVSIDLALEICVLPAYLRGHVRKALLDAFSNRALPGGALGFFHPDRLTFGDDIYLSAIIATAQAIPGVASVRVTRLQRQFEASNQEIENGVLLLSPFEIARLDSDPNYPDRGSLEIIMNGGR